jgi:RNA polymerase sigma-70 factor (ECF subfamily)
MKGVIPISYSDDQLIDQIQKKNKNALASLYDKYAAPVYGFICEEVNDKILAEEILQQTFLNAWNTFSYSPISKNHLLLQLINIARSITNKSIIQQPTDFNSDLKIAIV